MSFFNLIVKNPRDLFLNFTPEGSTWRSVSWNYDLKDPSERLWTLEVHKKEIESIEWSRDGRDEVKFFKNLKLMRKGRIPKSHPEFKQLMNLCLHSTIKQSLESQHEFLLTPVSGATTIDYQNETRALQWIQASLGTLMRALDQFENRPDLILTAAIFSGKEPNSEQNVLRIIAFNLDIFCYFHSDFTLQIAVFDDKNLGQGEAKTPTFQQIIKVTKPQIYDEIVKLVHRIAKVGEIS